jgi:CheY-like chemotaxis protein
VPPASENICAVVVDDNLDTAESFARLLTALGCQATFVTDPRATIAEIQRARPDIVFLDIGMPIIDGYQVADALRRLYDSEALKIVAVTGYGTREDRFRARKAGFDAHVTKPVDPAIVDSILKTLLPPLSVR